MKAIAVGKDGKLHWEDTDTPAIGPGEVLLEIHAAGINRADLLQRVGEYPPPPGWPDRFGLEAAGVICAIGEKVKRQSIWHIGDKACALLGSGGYAEYVAVPADLLMPMPEGITFAEAAALPEVYGAAYLFLCYEGHLRKGETLLMQAGASGLAGAVIPMAKSFGARVITTVQNAEMAAKIGHLRADTVIDTSAQSLTELLKAEYDAGRGIDLCIDCLGGEAVGECLPFMNVDGRWIMIATLAGDFTQVNLRSLYAKRIRLIGTNLRSRTLAQKKRLLADMVKNLWPKIESGELKPAVFKAFPISQAEEAQALMLSGKSAGKIVLIVRND